MSTSERMTIMTAFHQSNQRDFKDFYIGLVQRYWAEYFPELLSYTRFINTMSELIVSMCATTSVFQVTECFQIQLSAEKGQWVFRF
jgi:hypothetical protein